MVFNAQGKISYIFLQTFLKPDKFFSIIPCLHSFSYFICSWLSIFRVLNFQDWLEELGSFSDVLDYFSCMKNYNLILMSRKPKEKHTRCSLDGTEIKLLVFYSKPGIHEGFSWIHKEIKLESTRRKFDKTSVFIDNSLIYLLMATKHINTKINV